MLTLHQYPPAHGLPSLSPFCVKVESYLRACKLAYRVHTELNPGRGPKGKMPFIEDSGRVVADSSLIIQHLKKTYGDPLDAALSPSDYALGLSLQRLCEEHLYWILLYARWIDRDGFAATLRGFAPLFPFGLGRGVVPIIRKRLQRQGVAQGMLRHTPDEIYAMGREDLQGLADALTGKPAFLFGDTPTSFDLCIYAFLTTILSEPAHTPLKGAAQGSPTLTAYVTRVEDSVWRS